MSTHTVTKSVPGTSSAIEVHSASCFAVGLVLWRDENARPIATVVAKLSFRLAPGRPALLDPPEPLRSSESFGDDGPSRSHHAAPDLVPFKAAPEVLVVGQVYASAAAATGDVRVVVGPIDKRIQATSPRHFERRSRDSLLEVEDRAWLVDPLRLPRPRSFDARYFCAAPLDQRGGAPFQPGQTLALEGLHPHHARLVTSLPEVHPAFRSTASARTPVAFVADTLCIDTDRQLATLTFRALVPLADDTLVLELEALGSDAPSEGEEHTRELDNASDDAGGRTTELDRSALDGVASMGVPFPSPSEPVRSSFPNVDDGALPFRPSSPPPPAASAGLAPAGPPTSPAAAPAPLVPIAVHPAALQPPAAAQPPAAVPPPTPIQPATVQQPAAIQPPAAVKPPAPLAALGAPPIEPPPREFAGSPRSPVGDVFRRAFGLSAGAAGVASSESSAEPGALKRASAPPPSAPVTFDATTSPARIASDAAASADTRAAMIEARFPSAHGAARRRAVIDLLAFDPTVPSRLRRSRAHGPLLAVPPPPRAQRQLDAPADERSPEDRARADILRVLSCGTPLRAEELTAAVDALLDDPHDFDIPLFLVEGDLQPTMDELEALRTAVELAKPLAGANKRVIAALATASDALARPAPPTPEGALLLYKQLEAATGELGLPARHLAELVERSLREARSYKRRTLLGAPRIRAELGFGRAALPIYLPEAVASQLPLLPSFRVSALVESRPREDASEPSATALFALALGRVLQVRS